MAEKLGLYIHIPFCKAKCDYCDFYSLPDREEAMDLYLKALVTHLRETAPLTKGWKVDTVYIGGGTPSYFGAKRIAKLLGEVRRRFDVTRDAEITCEANPESADRKFLTTVRRSGVNRLSVGMQSASDAELQAVHRLHDFQQVTQAVAAAKKAKIKNLSLDLIYGLPGQSMDSWKKSLEAALALEPQHLSCYGLKVEPGTPLDGRVTRGEILPDDDTQADMYLWTVERLAQAGYEQYEISNYAQPGYSSAHNQVYWRTDNYLAVGLGACSWVRPLRWNNSFTMADYLAQVQASRLPQQEPEHLTEQEQMEETVFMALRMNQGLCKVTFQQRFGKPIEAVFADALQRCISQGWLEEAGGYLRLTEKGRVLGNVVFLEFIQ